MATKMNNNGHLKENSFVSSSAAISQSVVGRYALGRADCNIKTWILVGSPCQNPHIGTNFSALHCQPTYAMGPAVVINIDLTRSSPVCLQVEIEFQTLAYPASAYTRIYTPRQVGAIIFGP